MNYIRIMRIDHWIKQLFIIPGFVCALFLTKTNISGIAMLNLAKGFIATCFAASANYIINEWLDAEFDKYHPTKKNRPIVTEQMNGKLVGLLWGGVTALAFLIASRINKPFLCAIICLWIMGILYNVKPFRLKDIVFIDVLSESFNNALRLLLGWFVISDSTFPPCSLLLGYWMGGAFLMTVKRFAEFRMIGNPAAARYRRSFAHYSEGSLIIYSVFYAMLSTFLIGVFVIKYRIELILFVPLLMGLFCYYLKMSFRKDSAVQKPEKLYREKGLMIYCLLLVFIFVLLMNINIPWLKMFVDDKLIRI